MTDNFQPRRRRHRSPDNEQLSRDIWLDAASTVIAESGFEHVRILTLAERLGVTRGSFYWHFEDHSEFIKAYLDRWKAKRLNDIASRCPSTGDPQSKLHWAIRTMLGSGPTTPDRLQIELAIRDYARRHKVAAEMLAEIDRAQMSYAMQLLEKITNEPSKGLELAVLAMVVGGQMLLAGSTIDTDDLIQAVGRFIDLGVRGAKSGRR